MRAKHSETLYRTAVVLCWLSAAGLAISCANKAGGKQVESSSPSRPLSIQVSRVEVREIRRKVESVGSLFPLEEVTVSSEVEGKVDQVLVDVGDRVAANQAIVQVSPIELRLLRDQQRAALQQARARLGLSENDDLKDISEAPEVKKAAADLNDTEQKYRRAERLFKQGLVPKETYDETEARYKSARAAYDLAIQTVQNLRAQLSQYHAALELAEKKVGDSVIRAPFAGQVRERTVTQGQYLKVQTPVMVIVNVDTLRVRLKVPEKMAGWIKTGQEVTLSVEAYPNESFTGRLTRINPSVDQATRSFDVEALIANATGKLKPGFFVKARIPSGKVERALFVPPQALQYVYGIYKIFIVQGQALKEKEVRIGDRAGEVVEVIEGLKEGEDVALSVKGGELRDGAAVEIVHK